MKYCKYVFAVLCIAIIGIWIYLVYDINEAYPSPEDVVYKKGETFEYYGLKITPEDVQIYTYDEMCDQYEELKNDSSNVEERSKYYYIIVTLHIKNENKNEIIIKDDLVSYWMLETGLAANGMDMDMSYVVDYTSDIFKMDYEGEIEVPYFVYCEEVDNMSKQEILNQGIKIVLNYYPDKKYILFN